MPKRTAGALHRIANLGYRAIKRIKRAFGSGSFDKENRGSTSLSQSATVEKKVPSLIMHDTNNLTSPHTLQNDVHATPLPAMATRIPFPPNPLTPASVSLMPNYNRIFSASQQTVMIMEEVQDADHAPAVNPLPYDPLGPLMVEVLDGSVLRANNASTSNFDVF